MNRDKSGYDNRIFWGLIGAMSFVTVGVVSLACLTEDRLDSLKNYSLESFLPVLKPRAAMGQEPQLVRRTPSAAASSQFLPAIPEYENDFLALEELSQSEDPTEDIRLADLPAVEDKLSFEQPLTVQSRLNDFSLKDVTLQKIDEQVVVDALLETFATDIEDEDETAWIEHTVGQGERLVEISRKYGILVATISKANGITNPNRLTVGQKLLIPRSEELLDDVIEERKSRAEQLALTRQKAEPIEYKNYTVKPGDSLWTIASTNHLSVDSIYGTNVLRNPDKLSTGLTLRIPNQDGLSVKVAKGQTVATLAKKYNVTENAICMANKIDSKTQLKVGQDIFLPGASQSITVYRATSGGGGVSKRQPSVAKAEGGVSGLFSWPVVGGITSPFGWRTHPIRKKRNFHSGIDIKASRHTPIRAASAGQVIFAGWMNGYGRTVIIRHNSVYTTLYAHSQTLRVKKGDTVKKGQIISTVGSSGVATGPHVHFEVRRNDKVANPMSYLR